MPARSDASSFRLSRATVFVVHDDGALVGPDQPDDGLEEHALAGAGRAEERDGLALLDREVHAVQHHLLAETLPHPVQLDHWLSRSWASSTSINRIRTELDTTAPVVDRPTPSAPCWVLKPM